jgi:hypothetical protein
MGSNCYAPQVAVPLVYDDLPTLILVSGMNNGYMTTVPNERAGKPPTSQIGSVPFGFVREHENSQIVFSAHAFPDKV